MSDRTLTQILSKIKHGTIIRHVENFENFTPTSYHNEDRFWVRVENKSTLFLTKKDFESLKPFVCLLLYLF